MKHNTKIAFRLIPAAICAAPLVAFAGPTDEPVMTTPPPVKKWEFLIEPYAWLTAIDGTTGPNIALADVDAGFTDIFDMLEMAAALQFEARYDRWGVFGDVFYAKLGADGTAKGPLATSLDVDFEQFLGELDVFYRIQESPKGFLDAYAGMRVNSLSLDISRSRKGILGPVYRSRSLDKAWVDPIIGLRTQWNINDRWFLAGKADIGGFGVSSDFTWNIQATLGYNFTESVYGEFGYRYFDTDYSTGKFTYDIAQSGIFLGCGIEF